MDTSDTGSPSRPQVQVILAGGHPTPLEEEMRAKAAAGELLDCGGGPFDLAAMQLWGEERAVRAAVLRDLLVGGQWPVHAKGVRLRGARISGLLDLEGATLRCPLSLDSCYLDAADPACLDHATASRVALTRCQLTGLNANMLTARQLDLSCSTLRTGPLSLMCASIADELICSGARLNGTDADLNALVAGGMKAGGSVYLDQCPDGRFIAAGAVWLARADIGGDLACSGAQLGSNRDGTGLLAEGVKVGGQVFLREGFTADGAVRLLGADITGDISFRAAQLGSDHNGNALVADRMRVGGEVHLYRGFSASGAVVLNGADITGDLSFSGAQLTGTDHDGNALVADGMRAHHDVLLDRAPAGDGAAWLPFTAAGAVRLARADIAGQLGCSGAQLTGTDDDGSALVADGIKVGAAVLLDQGFTAAGTVSLNSARADQLVLSPARPAGASEIAFDFTAAEAQIAGPLQWAPGGQFSGRVNLEDAKVGELEDDWTAAGEEAHGCWPPGGRLRLSGFTYGGLGQASVQQRLGWIRSQYEGSKPAAFAAQPYEQLADMYRQAGQDTEARVVAIARRRDLRKYGNLNWYRRFGNAFLDKTIRYGYQTWRAAAGLAAVFVAFLVLSVVGQHQHVIVPLGDVKGFHPVPTATRCTSDYPCFYPFGYTVDTVIPIINVHQADHWGPDAHAPAGWLWVFGAWGATAAGWALATLLVAGYTGLVRQD
ncbi:MAG TPA: hypothetical protein VEC76_17870 [Streptosporangiaceae bacterium]|nr:hypothetical protein [Streptosporangiaceae bacterium]